MKAFEPSPAAGRSSRRPISRRGRTGPFALAALALFVAATSTAQSPSTWSSSGPFCARPISLAAGASPTDDAYLAVGGRLFRSRTAGLSWHEVGRELPGSFLSSVAVDPSDPRRVYFSIWGQGVFRSLDGGESWTPIFQGIPDPYVDRVVVPTSPTGTVFIQATYSGIIRSRDRGESWTDVTPPVGVPEIYLSLTSHPAPPGRLWALTGQHGLWKSDDAGDSWQSASAGLPPDFLTAFAVDPSNPEVAYIGRFQTLYKTSDALTWDPVGYVPTSGLFSLSALAVVPGQPEALLAGQDVPGPDVPGILRSVDGGLSWEPLPLAGESVFDLIYRPGTGAVVAFTAGGAFGSDDVGDTWRRLGSGVNAAESRALAVAGADGEVLLTGADHCAGGRIARSADGGRSWSLGGSMPFIEIGSFGAAPSDPDRVYAGAGNVVFRSDDAGLTWTPFPFDDGTSGGQVVMIAVHPLDPDRVFAATSSRGLARSEDGGATWQTRLANLSTADVTAVVIDPQSPGRMMASPWLGGLIRSLDGGATWQPVAGAEALRFSTLALDPSQPDRALAGTSFDSHPVYASTDFGLTWQPSDVGLAGGVFSLAFDPSQAGAVAATTESGLFRSTDGGAIWSRDDDGLPLDQVRGVAFDPSGRLYASTYGEGVYSKGATAYPEVCARSAGIACLLGGRFQVQGAMWDFGYPRGEYQAIVMNFPAVRAESDQAAFFESFNAGNFELGVKMVDACGLPAGHPLRAYWLFFGGLTNADSEVVVEDSVTGATVRWQNPRGQFPATLGDTGAFACVEGNPTVPCVRGAETACLLGGRFRVTGLMRDFEEPPREVPIRVMGFPSGRAESNQAAFFRSFAAGNFEIGVKMVDACALPAGHPLRAYWAFYGGLTNAETQVVVTRVTTGREDSWSNPAGSFPTAEGRTSAFPCDD